MPRRWPGSEDFQFRVRRRRFSNDGISTGIGVRILGELLNLHIEKKPACRGAGEESPVSLIPKVVPHIWQSELNW